MLRRRVRCYFRRIFLVFFFLLLLFSSIFFAYDKSCPSSVITPVNVCPRDNIVIFGGGGAAREFKRNDVTGITRVDLPPVGHMFLSRADIDPRAPRYDGDRGIHGRPTTAAPPVFISTRT